MFRVHPYNAIESTTIEYDGNLQVGLKVTWAKTANKKSQLHALQIQALRL